MAPPRTPTTASRGNPSLSPSTPATPPRSRGGASIKLRLRRNIRTSAPLLLLALATLLLLNGGNALPTATASGADRATLIEAPDSPFTTPEMYTPTPSRIFRRARIRKQLKACGFEGDADMYGLGIRIGYYIQWVATVFAAYFTPKVVSGAFEANAIFNIGMLAGLVYTTIARDDMYVVEPIMVLGFSVGGAIVGLLDPKNVHDAKNLHSLRARLVHLAGTGALSLPLLIYWIWYSFYGMDTMAYNNCSTSTFFIVKINIWATWFRVFMKVATIMSIVGLFSLAVGVVVAYRIKSGELPHGGSDVGGPGITGAPRLRPSASTPRLSRTTTALALRARPSKTQFIVVIISLAICALSVELSITWNNIEGVNILGATGQLIPMAIGIVTSFRVLVGILNNKFKSRKTRRKESMDERMFGGGGEMMRVGRGGGLLAFAGDDDPSTLDNLATGGKDSANNNNNNNNNKNGTTNNLNGKGGGSCSGSDIEALGGGGAGGGGTRASSIMGVSRSVKLNDTITTITANTSNYTYSNSLRSTAKRQSVVSMSTTTAADDNINSMPPLPPGKPRISPSSTSDSQGSMVYTPSVARAGSMRSGISFGLGPLPPPPAAAAAAAALQSIGGPGGNGTGSNTPTTPTAPPGSSIMSKSGRKKLQRKWKG
ncbi:hypothetical protein DFH27DRAFT_527299 [Peziza echinospora]|nr:hypothetical protein DFH27DRAFT_527299 [Peziza echinospora]